MDEFTTPTLSRICGCPGSEKLAQPSITCSHACLRDLCRRHAVVDRCLQLYQYALWSSPGPSTFGLPALPLDLSYPFLSLVGSLLVSNLQPLPTANMKIVPATLLACLLPSTALAELVGYSLWPYKPVCAFACDRSLTSYMLECSTDMAMGSGMDMSGDDAMTTAACRASDTPWLQTLAWCVHTKCAQVVAASELERFWETQCTGDASVAPKWTYGETLANISAPPTEELSADTDTQTLNFTALVNADTWLSQYNALYATQRENVVESGYRYGACLLSRRTTRMLIRAGKALPSSL